MTRRSNMAGGQPRSDEIGAREAETILEVDRNLLHRLIQRGQLRARMIDERGAGARRWLMKRSDVLALKERGARTRKRHKPPRRKLLWERYFGAIPHGFSPTFRDGNPLNALPGNLCLIPKAKLWSSAAKGERRKRSSQSVWTKQMYAILRREFPKRATAELAKELGVSTAAARKKASLLGLRKEQTYVRELQRQAKAYPVGTECKKWREDTLYVKVSDKGAPRQQWRPKHHLVWEGANSRPVPDGHRVLFKDGNRRNFEPSNLVAMTRNEASALSNIRFHSYPKELQDAVKLTRHLREESDRQIFGMAKRGPRRDPNRNKGGGRPGESKRRWTHEMDEILRRDYPHKLKAEVAATIGVTELALRLRARRLAIQRLPETIMAEARAKGEQRKAA